MNYKVLVPAILLKNNVQAVYGAVVTAEQLTASAELLVKEGYLEAVEAENAPAVHKPEETPYVAPVVEPAEPAAPAEGSQQTEAEEPAPGIMPDPAAILKGKK